MYPSENVVSKYGTTTLSQLEMQIIHHKKKPAKEYTKDFPEKHKDYKKLVISVPFSVLDTSEFPSGRNGDPFL